MIQKTVNEMSSSIPILSDEEILTEDEIEEYLDNLKSKLPSFVIILLKNNLRGKRVTKRQLDKIIERITEVLSKGKEDKTEELNKKLQNLEQKLDTIMKLTTMAASTKLSEELEKTKEESVETTIEIEEKSEKSTEHEKEPIEKTKEDVVKEETKEEKVEEKEKKSELESSKGEKSMISTSEEERQYRLNDIPEDAVSMALVFKWLEFLISKVGVVNLPDVLDYYNKIGWISNKVILKLLRFTKNMKIILDIDKVRPRDKLSPSDHIMSLLYIEKLAGRPIDPDVLEMLEIEIRRIKKWAEELQSL